MPDCRSNARKIRKLGLAALLFGLLCAAAWAPSSAHAADPLSVGVDGTTYAYQDVIEDGDFLVITRYSLVPDQFALQDAYASVDVDADGDADIMALTNRHYYTDTTSMLVEINDTDVTDYCRIGSDGVTITCTDIPSGTVAAGTYDAEVDYVGGWGAYDGSAVFYQLYDDEADLKAQKTLPATGYGMIGLYQAAGHGMTWSDADIRVDLVPSPTLWLTGETESSSPLFCGVCTTTAATKAQLETDVRQMLQALEADNPAIAPGDYVTNVGFTDAAYELLQSAWLPITTLLDTAFASRGANPFEAVTPGPTSWVATKEAEAGAEGIAGAWDNLAPGLGGDVMGGILFAILGGAGAIGILVVTHRVTGEAAWPLALASTWFVFSLGALVDAVPWQWAGFAAIFLITPGLIWIVREKVLGGG